MVEMIISMEKLEGKDLFFFLLNEVLIGLYIEDLKV
jgi:hypothetical protein